MADEQNFDDEAQLLRQVAKGDRQAFLKLYDAYASRVYGLCLRMLGDPMRAEDVVQETFLKVWSRARSFNPRKGSLITWLLTITRRTALDRIRYEGRRPDLSNVVGDQSEWAQLPDPKSTTVESRWGSLRFALESLPPEQRQVIELAYYHGMSQSEMAEFLDIPLGTVKTRVRLGMGKLRDLWMQNGLESPQDNRSETLSRDVILDERTMKDDD
jgi:RNA polymerase sigma-70 factor (ECF subfamily)